MNASLSAFPGVADRVLFGMFVRRFDLRLVAATLLCAACQEPAQPADESPQAGSGGATSPATGGTAHLVSGGGGGDDPGAGGQSLPSSGGRLAQGAGGAPSSGAGGVIEPDATPAVVTSFDAFWDFETTDGDQVPALVGRFGLELVGAETAPAATGGFELDLSSGAGSATTSGPVLDTADSFSISAWVRLDALADYDTFVALDGSTVSAAYLQKRSDDRFALTTFASDDINATPCVTTAEIQPRSSQWYHVVATRDRASRVQRIYVDGVLSFESTCPGGVFSAAGPVRVGSGLWDGEARDFVSGAIDDVGVVARVLSPRDVLDLYRAGRPADAQYLFAYFVEVGQGRGDGLRLAHSHDALHWGAIGAGKVFMPPSVGGGSFRDPHVMRDPFGTYHLVWTTSCVPWAESNCVQDRGFGHATSPDLVDWSPADYVTIDLDVEHVWAPETIYDAESERYMMFFSAPIDNDPAASDPHSLYYVLTRDFASYSEPQLLYGPAGRNFIDGTISARDDGYLMILKDEAGDQKNLRALRSSRLFGDGAWNGAPSAPLTGNYAAEGPSILERNGQSFIYFDKYGEGSYGALEATTNSDLILPSSWQDISSSVFFPGVRHGTPIEVPWEVFESVALAAGTD